MKQPKPLIIALFSMIIRWERRLARVASALSTLPEIERLIKITPSSLWI